MKKSIFFTVFAVSIGIAKAQTLISIPDTLSGASINLTIEDSVHQFYVG